MAVVFEESTLQECLNFLDKTLISHNLDKFIDRWRLPSSEFRVKRPPTKGIYRYDCFGNMAQ